MVNTETIKNLGLKDIHVGSEPALIHEYIICGALVLFLVLLAAYAVYRLWPVFKAALAMMGLIENELRLPLCPLDPGREDQLRAALAPWGVLG